MRLFVSLSLLALAQLAGPAMAAEGADTTAAVAYVPAEKPVDTFSNSCAPNDSAALTIDLKMTAPSGMTLALWGAGLDALKTGALLNFSGEPADLNNGLTMSYCPDDQNCTLVSGLLTVKDYEPGKYLRGSVDWTDLKGQTQSHVIDANHSGNQALCG